MCTEEGSALLAPLGVLLNPFHCAMLLPYHAAMEPALVASKDFLKHVKQIRSLILEASLSHSHHDLQAPLKMGSGGLVDSLGWNLSSDGV